MTSSTSKSWTFTINNYTESDIRKLTDLEKTYLIYGQEVGESGTPHLQGFLILKKSSRMPALKKIFPTAHWEIAKVACAAANYCLKDDNYTIIDNRAQGQRTDLAHAMELVRTGGLPHLIEQAGETYVRYHAGLEKISLYYQKPRTFKPIVTWIYGPTGTGKTRSVVEKHDDLWISLSTLKWWDGYDNQEAVLIDDFRADYCTYHELLRILDRYPFTVQVKGSTRKLNSKYMYITSCYPPDQVYQTREDIQQLLRRIDNIVYTGE